MYNIKFFLVFIGLSLWNDFSRGFLSSDLPSGLGGRYERLKAARRLMHANEAHFATHPATSVIRPIMH